MMWNGMGNNNTSGFHEEGKNNHNNQEKSPKQPQVSVNNANHIKEENGIAAAAESRGHHEKETVLASDYPTGAGDDHPPNLRADEGVAETEVLPLVEHPTAQLRLEEAGGEWKSSCFSNQLIDQEEPTDLNKGDSELKKLDSSKKEGKVPMHVQETEKVNGYTSEEESSNLHTGTGDTAFSMEENCEGLETYLSANQDELDLLCTVLDEVRRQENLSIEGNPSTAVEEKLEAGERYQGANCLMSEMTPSEIRVDINVTGLKEADETNLGTDDTVVPESEASLLVDSLNTESDSSVLGKNRILATNEETLSDQAGQKSDRDEEKRDPGISQPSLDLTGNRDSGESDATRDSATKVEESTVISQESASNGSCQVSEPKVTEQLEQEASEESFHELQEGKMVVPKLGNIPSEFHNLNGQKGIEEGEQRNRNLNEELAEKQIVEETATEASPVTMENPEGTEWQEQQHMHLSVPLQPEESTSQNNNHQAPMVPDHDDQGPKTKFGSWFEFNHVVEDPNYQATSLAKESSEPEAAMQIAKHQELETCYDLLAPPNKTQTSKVQDKLHFSASTEAVEYEAQETTDRFSTESNPENFSIPYLRKSPSFGFDLRIDARSEESDRTPLLFQSQTTVERSFPSQDGPFGEQLTCQYQTMQVEEKVIISLGRSDSEKSGTPFLGFPNGEVEEARVIVIPKKQDSYNSINNCRLATKQVSTAESKTKEKHKRRSSFFGSCICCTSVIN